MTFLLEIAADSHPLRHFRKGRRIITLVQAGIRPQTNVRNRRALLDAGLMQCLTFPAQPFEEANESHVPMSEQPVQDALARFSAALDRLEAASLRHQEGERLRHALESELALMRADRQALAERLDHSTFRARQVEEELAALDQRIERAIAAVRDALSEGG
jgi:chromosome segregation ATPase